MMQRSVDQDWGVKNALVTRILMKKMNGMKENKDE